VYSFSKYQQIQDYGQLIHTNNMILFETFPLVLCTI